MATLTTYRGLSVLSTTPPGLGGAAINTDLIALADRFIHLATVNPTTSDKSPTYSVGNRWFNTTTNTEFVLIDDAAGTWKALASGATTISTTAPLTGGGDLSANRTLSITAADGSNAGSMSAANFTLLTGATNANTANAIVKRDGNGDFSAGTVNAATAVNVNSIGVSHAMFIQLADKTVANTTLASTDVEPQGGEAIAAAEIFTFDAAGEPIAPQGATASMV